MEQKLTIEELLKSMLTLQKDGGVSDGKRQLENSLETWKRINSKDSFSELGFSSDSEKDTFIKEWIQSNPYSSL
jgi:hypothetical protein